MESTITATQEDLRSRLAKSTTYLEKIVKDQSLS